MSLRSVIVTVSCLLLGVGLLATVLVGLLRYQYRWYKLASLPPGESRKVTAQEFVTEFAGLWDTAEPEWYAHFSDVQINSYLQEGFREGGFEARSLPDGHVSDPRVAFDNERIHLAFRYGSGLFSTVICIDLRLWLVPQERNVLVLELEGFHAGALPISTRSVLEKISEFAKGGDKGIGVTWYRDQQSGHPVAVLRFQDDKPKPTIELLAVQPEPGYITIRGRFTDSAPVRTPTVPILP